MRYLVIAILGLLGLLALRRGSVRPPPPPPSRIRVAGRTEMHDPPAHWSETDERSDESFPASDPPGTY